jgi:hypothetical protein
MGVRRASVEQTPAHAPTHIGYVRGTTGLRRHSRVPDPIRSLAPAAILALTSRRSVALHETWGGATLVVLARYVAAEWGVRTGMTEDLSIRSTDKTLTIIGAIAAIVPFVIHASSSSSVTENGVVVASSYRDNVALAGGIVAVLCGLAAAALARRSGGARIGIAIAVLALGAYQIARGLGAL